MRKNDRKIYIGTSGWHYLHWKEVYYPENLPTKSFLKRYAQDLCTVEINNTFYRLPSLKTVRMWKKTVPKNFIFSVKASRYITHIKRLLDPHQILKKFLRKLAPLESKIGVILFQLPVQAKCNPERLEKFLLALPKHYRYAFEFRNHSWFNERIYRLLKKFKIALCIYDLEQFLSPKKITASFIYLRLHGPKSAYSGSYSDRSLKAWAEQFKVWKKAGKEIFCYFNNDEAGYAVQNALTLKNLIGKRR